MTVLLSINAMIMENETSYACDTRAKTSRNEWTLVVSADA